MTTIVCFCQISFIAYDYICNVIDIFYNYNRISYSANAHNNMENKNLIKDPEIVINRHHKLLLPFAMVWISLLLLTTFTALKTFDFFGYTIFAAVIAYPITYVFLDIFTEVYGYRTSRRIIWTGLLCIGLTTSFAYLYTLIPPSVYFGEFEDKAFNLIFQSSPVIALAFIVSYWAGENVNSIVLAKMKIYTDGKYAGIRYVGSTFFGQIADNVTGVSIMVLIGNLFTYNEAFSGMITAIIFCTVWEMLALPITKKLIVYIKYYEGVDTYDKGTQMHPFSLK